MREDIMKIILFPDWQRILNPFFGMFYIGLLTDNMKKRNAPLYSCAFYGPSRHYYTSCDSGGGTAPERS